MKQRHLKSEKGQRNLNTEKGLFPKARALSLNADHALLLLELLISLFLLCSGSCCPFYGFEFSCFES